MKEIGVECPGRTVISNLCQKFEKIESLTNYRWVTRKKVFRKVRKEATGEEAAMFSSEMVNGSKMRMHKYNIYRQFSELKWLKANLKEDEVKHNVDFSKNCENK